MNKHMNTKHCNNPCKTFEKLYNKAKAISAKLLELNLKSKLEETGK